MKIPGKRHTQWYILSVTIGRNDVMTTDFIGLKSWNHRRYPKNYDTLPKKSRLKCSIDMVITHRFAFFNGYSGDISDADFWRSVIGRYA